MHNGSPMNVYFRGGSNHHTFSDWPAGLRVLAIGAPWARVPPRSDAVGGGHQAMDRGWAGPPPRRGATARPQTSGGGDTPGTGDHPFAAWRGLRPRWGVPMPLRVARHGPRTRVGVWGRQAPDCGGEGVSGLAWRRSTWRREPATPTYGLGPSTVTKSMQDWLLKKNDPIRDWASLCLIKQ